MTKDFLDVYIDSMHPSSEKERKKLNKLLKEFWVIDKDNGIREIRVPKRCNIPFRGNLYCWSDLMDMDMQETYYRGIRDEAGLVVDGYGLLWLRIHNHDSAYDDDPEVFFPVEDANEAAFLYDKEGPYISKYFWNDPDDVLVVPHFRFNDAPYLYLVTNDLALSKDEVFDQLVVCNALI